MKKMFYLSVILLILAGKTYSQDHHPVSKIADSTYTYFGVVYKDALRFVDTIRKPQVETLYKHHLRYSNTFLTEIPDRYKMIAGWEMKNQLSLIEKGRYRKNIKAIV